MAKEIYCGPATGLYSFEKFREFMRSRHSFLVKADSTVKYPFQIWAPGCTLVDYASCTDGKVRVCLGGDPAEKDKIEEMILSAAAALK